jgi:hypothetical protein
MPDNPDTLSFWVEFCNPIKSDCSFSVFKKSLE